MNFYYQFETRLRFIFNEKLHLISESLGETMSLEGIFYLKSYIIKIKDIILTYLYLKI